MQKSRWIIASAAIAGMMGFGHAGCYTSGTPGGTGFGGTSSTGGRSSSLGGSDAGEDEDAATDAGTDAGSVAVVRECENSYRCLDENKPVCNTNTGQCVQCTKHDDCIGRDGPYCDITNYICVKCLPTAGCNTDQRCVSSECISKTNCSTDRVCRALQPMQVCSANDGYCVECTAAVPCADFAPETCANGQCTCESGLCRISGIRVSQVDAG